MTATSQRSTRTSQRTNDLASNQTNDRRGRTEVQQAPVTISILTKTIKHPTNENDPNACWNIFMIDNRKQKIRISKTVECATPKACWIKKAPPSALNAYALLCLRRLGCPNGFSSYQRFGAIAWATRGTQKRERLHAQTKSI